MCGATLTGVGATTPWFPADMRELAFVSKGTSVKIVPSADLGSAGSASLSFHVSMGGWSQAGMDGGGSGGPKGRLCGVEQEQVIL